MSVLHNPPNWVLVPPVKATTESLSCRYHRTFINATSKEHRVHLNFLCIVGSIYTNIKLSLNTSCVALKNHETKKTCKFALHISKIPLIYLIYHLQMLLFIYLWIASWPLAMVLIGFIHAISYHVPHHNSNSHLLSLFLENFYYTTHSEVIWLSRDQPSFI